jgi:hypothetical protein
MDIVIGTYEMDHIEGDIHGLAIYKLACPRGSYGSRSAMNPETMKSAPAM